MTMGSSGFDELQACPPREREGFPRTDETFHCAQCLYDLRGLAHDGRCPECGHPISHSLSAHRHSARVRETLSRWRNRLIAAGVVAWLLAVASPFVGERRLVWILYAGFVNAAIVAALVIGILIYVGIILPSRGPLSRSGRRSVWWLLLALAFAVGGELAWFRMTFYMAAYYSV